MKIFFVAVLSFFSVALSAQTNNSVVGRWKVIIMSDSEMYLDFTRDSLWLNRKLETREDSALLKEITPYMFSSLGTLEYVFNKGGSMEIKTRIGDEQGRFTVNEKEKLITAVFQRNGKEVTNLYSFEFAGPHLRLKEMDDKKEITMMLQRQQ